MLPLCVSWFEQDLCFPGAIILNPLPPLPVSQFFTRRPRVHYQPHVLYLVLPPARCCLHLDHRPSPAPPASGANFFHPRGKLHVTAVTSTLRALHLARPSSHASTRLCPTARPPPPPHPAPPSSSPSSSRTHVAALQSAPVFTFGLRFSDRILPVISFGSINRARFHMLPVCSVHATR